MAEWIAFKECVRVHTLVDGKLWDAIRTVARVAPPLHHLTMVVTSVSDQGHGEESLHYVGRAFDVRTKGTRKGAINAVLEDQQRETELWAGRIRSLLGKDWDVVVEVDHIHVEYDPK